MVTEIVEPQNDQVSRRTVLWGVLNVAMIMLGLVTVLWGAGPYACAKSRISCSPSGRVQRHRKRIDQRDSV